MSTSAMYIRKYAPYLGMLFAVILGFLLWQYFHQPKPVTYESQQTAETPAGVKDAADAAHIKMLQGQLTDAAKQIAKLQNQKPDTVTHTIVKEVPVVVERERQSAKADFAIVTDPKHPDKKVDLGAYKETEPIVLNQYNVQAYKKILRGINYYPKSIDDWTPQEITADWSRKISNDGKYLGVAAEYEFDKNRTKLGVRVTF